MKTFLFIFIAAGLMGAGCSKEDDNQPEKGTVTDIDGNTYVTVKIGEQWWMAENLKVTLYRNGDSIPNITSGVQWSALDTGAWCSYDNNPDHVELYGRLYNWYVVTDNRNIAPTGWHVATNDDWIALITTLGGEISAGNELEKYNFNTYPGGYRLSGDGDFQYLDNWGSWWTSTTYDVSNAWNVTTSTGGSWIGRASEDKRLGSSVRCVKD